MIFSASVDGLICLYDTSGAIDDDDHLESVINVGTPARKIGFFGANNQSVWCLTHIESLRLTTLKGSWIMCSLKSFTADTIERGYIMSTTDPTGLPKIQGLPTSSFYSTTSEMYGASPKQSRSRKHSGELQQTPFYGKAYANGNGGDRNSFGLYPTVDH